MEVRYIPPLDAALLTSPAPEGPPVVLERTDIGLPTKYNTFSSEGTQMVQAHMPCRAAFDPAHDWANALIRALDLQGHILNAAGNCFDSNGNFAGFVGWAGPTPGTDSLGACTDAPVHHSDAAAQGGPVDTSSVPTRDGGTISPILLHIRGKRLRPQTFEGDIKRLYDRLISEGADIGAACILRFIIFENGVTFNALVAPIATPELLRASSGAARMWGLLLQTTETTEGKQKYRCLLCPLESRVEYTHSRDAVRHFNRDHFGFSFPCEYW